MKLNPLYIVLFCFLAASCGGAKNATSAKGKAKDEIGVSYRSQEFLMDGISAKMVEEIKGGVKDYTEAIRLFNLSIKEDPSNDAAYYELALIYFESGRFQDAKTSLDLALKGDSDNKWYMIMNVAVLEQIKSYEAASSAYKTLLEKHPDESSQYFEWARMLITAGKFEEALKVYEEYEEKHGFDEQVAHFKHMTYNEMGQNDKAVEEIRKLIAHDPDNIGHYQTLAEQYKKSLGKEEELKTVLNDILKIDANNSYALYNIAEIYRSNSDREKYLEYLEKAFRNPTSNIDEKVGVIYPYTMSFDVEKDRKEEILSLAQILIEVHPNEAVTHKMYGRLLQQDDNKEEALNQFNKALEIDGSDFDTWQQIFFLSADLQKYTELVSVTEKALELYPNQALVYYFSGIAYNQLEEYDKAAKKLETGAKRASGNPLLKAQIFGSLGEAYNGAGQYAASDTAFEKAIELDGQNPYVLNNYSYYLSLRNEHLDRAEELSKRSNEMEPGNASFEDTYAWIMFQRGKYDEAKIWIEKAIQSMKGAESSEVTEHYGDILFKLGDIQKALEQWEKALEQGGDVERLKSKIAKRKL